MNPRPLTLQDLTDLRTQVESYALTPTFLYLGEVFANDLFEAMNRDSFTSQIFRSPTDLLDQWLGERDILNPPRDGWWDEL